MTIAANVKPRSEGSAGRSGVNPITLEIVRNGLTMIAEQISRRMIRAGTSYIIKEMEDCSAALFDGQARLLAESASIPIHLNCIGITLKTVLEHYYPADTWRPGDVVITNDPYAGGESKSSHHTNDIIAFYPVFSGERLVGFTALNTHHMDIGAMWMGTRGWGVEIWQEGLRIPPLKLMREGKLDQSLMALVLNNTRVPLILENDLIAEMSAIQKGAEEMQKIFDSYGTDTVLDCFDELIRQSEVRTRAEIAAIPDGVYRHEEKILDDGAKGGPYNLCLTMTVEGDSITFDYTGTDPQIDGPINAPLSATMAATYYVMKCITDPTIPNTEGCSQPITIIAPPGSLVNAQLPAACFQRMIVCHSIVDLIMGAMAQAVPERSMADSCGCLYNSVVAPHLETGEIGVASEVVPGGIGATSRADGLNVMSCHVTNCPIPPIEATEIEAPVLYLRREFSQDSGGAGYWRGGLGQVLEYKVLGKNPLFHHTSQKSVIPPQGMMGGMAGNGGGWYINRGTPAERKLEYAIGDVEFLNTGDVVTHISPGGGGYGNPLERDREKVRRDIEADFISREAAEKLYGYSF
ncbi:hydantoinase B/oxoprolinase family protein [Aquamicrobium defluvii]|uniref:Hydantoin utilization protein n=1 Tax=Aquamicrobium defluvii TaxID=69279 RepID=A0A011TEJ8_9HYPH|nr:hydantoinase B/oxoprolinase family protein [Aquamicrobium defluvii]EXL02307.1 hydantoin utilization protein [Aquamicrobium defluvii]EZQ13021.1 hydantoin utilization protein [Halopseudomonas bauzanensis]TDR32635.1 N-methylhydantoinase B [Aquamicrobium defluvii]